MYERTVSKVTVVRRGYPHIEWFNQASTKTKADKGIFSSSEKKIF